MNSIMDNLTKALDMNPLVVEEQKEEQLPVVVEETNDAEQDFELARKNLQELAKKGNKALDELIMLAKNSEHPRAYANAKLILTRLVAFRTMARPRQSTIICSSALPLSYRSF
jgi:uncharacterized protein with gpF-like domain